MQTPNTHPDPKPLAELLQSRALQSLLHKTQQITETNQLWQQALAVELRPHCHIMNITQHALVVEVDSATWATRVHYLSDFLLEELQKKLPYLSSVTKIHCRVRPTKTTSHHSPPSPRPISRNTVGLIQTTAHIIQHPALKAALLRLAQTKSTHAK
ncbi:MAG: hypothetical protein A3F41_02095 [Coxiella sp. RIFCSPHIGHO2_12_FULL_44_14]|nr:MAG: hypothetical protein A3F41_02095 [Coxiella sp. RIFCSPHIGHO2_12_FULL_44_14]